MNKNKLIKRGFELHDNTSPGYLGGRRDEVFAEWNEKFGERNWTLGWLGHDEEWLNYLGACDLYEQSYVRFLAGWPRLLDQLLESASDVYDDSPTNVCSGLDYTAQETERTHIQDIAIRRTLKVLGEEFKGTELVQIRSRLGKSPLSLALSPGQVPFVRMASITKPDNYDEIIKRRWWIAGSVEDFYQLNKRLFVRK